MSSVDNLRYFLDRFPNRFGSCIRSVNAASWRPVSQWHSLSDAEIANCIETQSNVWRSYELESENYYLVLSIKSSPAWTEVAQALALTGISYQISEMSEQSYLYIPFSNTVDIADGAKVLEEWIETAFSEGMSSQINVLRANDHVPFPLQTNFYWVLPNSLSVYRASLSLVEALAMYASLPSQKLETLEELKAKLTFPPVTLVDSKSEIEVIQLEASLPALKVPTSVDHLSASRLSSSEKDVQTAKPLPGDLTEDSPGQSRQKTKRLSRQPGHVKGSARTSSAVLKNFFETNQMFLPLRAELSSADQKISISRSPPN